MLLRQHAYVPGTLIACGSQTENMHMKPALPHAREDCPEAARAAGTCEPTDPYDRTTRFDPASALAPDAPVTNNPRLEGRSILCAQPQPALQSFLREVFKSAEVLVVSTGGEALTRFNQSAFEAFVLDYWLPDWSSVIFCREIRKTDPHVPIIFCGSGSEDASKRALRSGADILLTMPIDPQVLRGQVQRVIVSREANIPRATAEAHRAVEAELERHAGRPKPASLIETRSAARFIERGARAKAMKAFIDAGGTRAQFERTWPGLIAKIARCRSRNGLNLDLLVDSSCEMFW